MYPRRSATRTLDADDLRHPGAMRAALQSAYNEVRASAVPPGAAPAGAGTPSTFGELWEKRKRELRERVHDCVGWHASTSVSVSVGFLRDLADAIADDEQLRSAGASPNSTTNSPEISSTLVVGASPGAARGEGI